MRAFRYVSLGLVLALVSVLLWGFAIEPRGLHLRSYRWPLPDLPAGCIGLRVAVAADIHAGSVGGIDRVDQAVRLIVSGNPDLVLLAGDFLSPAIRGGMSGGTSRRFIPPEDVASGLASLPKAFPSYAVLGDQDWRFNAQRMQTALERAGIVVLENRTETYDRGSCRLWITGISDFGMGQHNVKRAFTGVPAGVRPLVITHDPGLIGEIPSPFTMLVAGHTHGGQVRWPWVASPYPPRDDGALSGRGNVFVTPGIGTSFLPFRFNVPPEVSMLELRDSQN